MKWFHSILTDGTDDLISSKRLVTFLAIILCSIAFIANLFFGFVVDEKLFDGMMYIVIAGIGFTASEKFSNK